METCRPDEVDLVLDTVRRVSARGTSVLFVSHSIQDVKERAAKVDRPAGRRDHPRHPRQSASTADMIEALTGVAHSAAADSEAPVRQIAAAGEVALRVRGLSAHRSRL